jgi:hypothetical protein
VQIAECRSAIGDFRLVLAARRIANLRFEMEWALKGDARASFKTRPGGAEPAVYRRRPKRAAERSMLGSWRSEVPADIPHVSRMYARLRGKGNALSLRTRALLLFLG